MFGEILHPIVAPICMKCLPLSSLQLGHVRQALLGKSEPTKRIAELVMLAEFMLVPLLIATYTMVGLLFLHLKVPISTIRQIPGLGGCPGLTGPYVDPCRLWIVEAQASSKGRNFFWQHTLLQSAVAAEMGTQVGCFESHAGPT